MDRKASAVQLYCNEQSFILLQLGGYWSLVPPPGTNVLRFTGAPVFSRGRAAFDNWIKRTLIMLDWPGPTIVLLIFTGEEEERSEIKENTEYNSNK